MTLTATRIDFAPGHEDGITERDVAAHWRVMRAAPALLTAALLARLEIVALSKSCGEGLLTAAALKALDEAIAAAEGRV